MSPPLEGLLETIFMMSDTGYGNGLFLHKIFIVLDSSGDTASSGRTAGALRFVCLHRPVCKGEARVSRGPILGCPLTAHIRSLSVCSRPPRARLVLPELSQLAKATCSCPLWGAFPASLGSSLRATHSDSFQY